MASTAVNSLLKSLGQIVLASVASYGAAKLTDSSASWTTYRNQMAQEAAAAALTAALTQYTAATSATTTETTTQA